MNVSVGEPQTDAGGLTPSPPVSAAVAAEQPSPADTVQWHLDRAAVCELLAASETRRGFYDNAEKYRAEAQEHRERAEALDPRTAA